MKSNNASRFCPICSCENKTFIYRQNFNNKEISLVENYDVVVCVNCGFVYADNIPSQSDFSDYYASLSKYEFNYNNGVVSKDHLNHFTKIVNFLAPYLTDPKLKILDIGCSTGGLLSLLNKSGYTNLFGIDPSEVCVETTKRLYNIKAFSCDILNFDSKEKFDLIILSAVLEHLVDLDNSLRKIRSLLNDQGLLFIEVPDVERFDLFISAPFQQFSTEHINYFSRYSITNLLSKFSFQTLELQQNESKLNQFVDPDIFILSKKINKIEFNLTKDNISETKIRSYINRCLERDFEIKEIIKERLLNKDRIIVWGVGTHTQRLIGTGLNISKILYFVDSNKRYFGKKLMGKEIKSPSEIKEDVPILISTFVFQEEIAYLIKEILKLKNEIIKIY